MREDEDTHGTTTIHASKGGNGAKWLLGAGAAALLLGGGYLAWKNSSAGPERTQTAYNETYAPDADRAGPMDQNQDNFAPSATNDEPIAAPASSDLPRRRQCGARQIAVWRQRAAPPKRRHAPSSPNKPSA